MNTHFPTQSLSLSMMISEATYRAVVGVERLAVSGYKLLRAGK